MDSYNNSNIVAKRKLNTAIRYSKLSIVFSVICLAYIAMMMVLPPVEFFSIAHIIMLIIDKLLLYICPILAVLFAIFGMQQAENALRKPALAISIFASILAVVAIIMIIYSLTAGVIGWFGNMIDWARKLW